MRRLTEGSGMRLPPPSSCLPGFSDCTYTGKQARPKKTEGRGGTVLYTLSFFSSVRNTWFRRVGRSPEVLLCLERRKGKRTKGRRSNVILRLTRREYHGAEQRKQKTTAKKRCAEEVRAAGGGKSKMRTRRKTTSGTTKNQVYGHLLLN